MNEIDLIKDQLRILQKAHAVASESDADNIESKAEDLLIEYCKGKGFSINGFPGYLEDEEYELDEDVFVSEMYQCYLGHLTQIHEDVADLTWFYTSTFWPETFDSKKDYLATIKALLVEGVIYQFKL